MRTCPKCGYREPECWRNHKWIINVTYCEIEELKFWEPELYKEIIEQKPTEQLPLYIHPFVYVLKPAGYVWRIDSEEYKLQGFNRNLTEHPSYQERIRLAGAQTKLPELIAENMTKPDQEGSP